jgi:hypothetical protein
MRKRPLLYRNESRELAEQWVFEVLASDSQESFNRSVDVVTDNNWVSRAPTILADLDDRSPDSGPTGAP